MMAWWLIMLGGEKLRVTTDTDTIVLERAEVADKLPLHIKRLIEWWCRDRRVVTWPGSFTNIRVWSLILNASQSLSEYQCTFHTITKIDLLQWLSDQHDVPSKSLLFIGQKKRARLYDHPKKTYNIVSYASLDELSSDYMSDSHHTPSECQIAYGRQWVPQISFGDHEYDCTQAPWSESRTVIPDYVIDPVTT